MGDEIVMYDTVIVIVIGSEQRWLVARLCFATSLLKTTISWSTSTFTFTFYFYFYLLLLYPIIYHYIHMLYICIYVPMYL